MEQLYIMFQENPDAFDMLDVELKDKLLKTRVQKENGFQEKVSPIKVTPTRKIR